MVTIAVVSRSDCVGDQRDAVRAGDTDGHFQHRWRNMFKIGDQLDRHALIKQQRCDRSWLPVMQRWHRIEKVGCNTRAGIDGLRDDRRVCTGVSNRHDCSCSDDLWDRRERAIDLRRHRHHCDLAAGKQLGQLIVGNPTQSGGIVCAAVGRRQPWALQVDANERAVGNERQQPLNVSQQVAVRGGGQAAKARRRAMSAMRQRRLARLLRRARQIRPSPTTVAVKVDKARQHDRALQRLDSCLRQLRRSAVPTVADPILFDQDPAVSERTVNVEPLQIGQQPHRTSPCFDTRASRRRTIHCTKADTSRSTKNPRYALSMKQRALGSSGVNVSEVGFGVWTVATGWWGEYSDDEAVALLRHAHDRGINFFDTADTYGEGRGETLLEKAFGADSDVVIGTKFGYDIYSPWERKGHVERPHDWTPAFVKYALEQSLRRLGRDHIGFYQLHNPRLDALQDDGLFEMLDGLVQAGTIGSIGVALGPAIGWRTEGLWAIENRPIHAIQVIHNLLEQQPGRDFIASAKNNDTSIVVRVPHSSGMLEGKYTLETVFDENDHRRHRPKSWLVEGVQKVEQVRFLEREDRTMGQAAIQWLLHENVVASVLPNIYNVEQIDEFAASSDTAPLTDEEFRTVEDLWEDDFGVAPYVEETSTVTAD